MVNIAVAMIHPRVSPQTVVMTRKSGLRHLCEDRMSGADDVVVADELVSRDAGVILEPDDHRAIAALWRQDVLRDCEQAWKTDPVAG